MVTLTWPNIRTGPDFWKNGSSTGPSKNLYQNGLFGPKNGPRAKDQNCDLPGFMIRGYLVQDNKMQVDSTGGIFPNLMKNMKSLLTWISCRTEIANNDHDHPLIPRSYASQEYWAKILI